jgi:ribosomal protein S18 acetylase RimI-like enzyme
LYRAAVVDAAIDLYCAAFAARQSHGLDADQVPAVAPGIRGVVGADGKRVIRLVVTDDRGYDRLAGEVPAARGEVNVFEEASRCDGLLRGQSGWNADRPATAMVLRDARAVASASLPDGLLLRPVSRHASEAPGAVPLLDAVGVAIASDPGITDPADDLARFLTGLSSSVRLFAAVDGAGVVRATSGYDLFGGYARVFFVNTEPGWRRQGIGRAMTAAALRAAASAGARRAFLHATEDGVPVYVRLGFEAAGRLTRYARAA